MKARLILFVTLFLLMLVTGVFWGTWFTLTRSIRAFSPAEFIHIGQVIIANVAAPMRIIFPACLFFMLLSLVAYPEKKTIGFYWGVAALVLLAATLVITLTILVPIDNEIREWTAATAPPNWDSLRNRWDQFHTVRTFTALGSFACYALAILNYPFARRHAKY